MGVAADTARVNAAVAGVGAYSRVTLGHRTGAIPAGLTALFVVHHTGACTVAAAVAVVAVAAVVVHCPCLLLFTQTSAAIATQS